MPHHLQLHLSCYTRMVAMQMESVPQAAGILRTACWSYCTCSGACMCGPPCRHPAGKCSHLIVLLQRTATPRSTPHSKEKIVLLFLASRPASPSQHGCYSSPMLLWRRSSNHKSRARPTSAAASSLSRAATRLQGLHGSAAGNGVTGTLASACTAQRPLADGGMRPALLAAAAT